MYYYYIRIVLIPEGSTTLKLKARSMSGVLKQLSRRLVDIEFSSLHFSEPIPVSTVKRQQAINMKRAQKKRRKKEYEQRVMGYDTRGHKGSLYDQDKSGE